MLSLVPEYKVTAMYTGTCTEPEFWRWLLRKRSVHIGVQLKILPEYRGRAPSVNNA